MKKFAWIIAALSLCAFTFAGCDDDNSNDNNSGGGQVQPSEKKANGAECADNSECQSGLCSGGVCGAQANPGEKKEDGQPCSSAIECSSGACTGGVCGAGSASGADDCMSKGCSAADEICNPSSKKCEKLNSNCEAEGFVEFCSSKGPVSCVAGKLTQNACGDGLACHILNDSTAQCVEECTSGAPSKSICLALMEGATEYVSKQECKSLADGSFGFLEVAQDNCLSQGKVCNDGQCVTSGTDIVCDNAIEGTDFTGSCDGNVRVYTYIGKYESCNSADMAHYDCTSDGGCQDDGNGYANCKNYY